ncbi:MAG TPA: glycosyltransferase [Nitrospiraceae bacterium]|nr:glycosyltransferase [Nitrospiraceae bacterium]
MSVGSVGDKIRVLRIIGRLNIGGPAIHVVNLSAGLDPSRFEQLLVVGTENSAEGSMLDHALSKGVKPLIIPEIVTAFSLTPRDLKALVKLYLVIRRQRPHIVHTHTAKAGFLGRLAAWLAGVPLIVHTYHGHVLHGYFGPVKALLLCRMERGLARFTNCILTVSEEIKRELVTYGVAPAEKIIVIPLGFDLEPFLNCQRLRGQFRREFGLNAESRLVGIVGRLFPIKNHRLFLDAAARIATCERAARFVIVGDGALRSAIEQQAKELGIADQVLFTGWRRDLPRVYADLDVLVVSSDNEGTPVSAIEAMAAGCPVVGTRVGGIPDLIIENETGFLVTPRDPESLATAVLDVLQNAETARRIGRNAMAMVRTRFALQRLIADMDHLYRELLRQKAPSFPSTKYAQARRSI